MISEPELRNTTADGAVENVTAEIMKDKPHMWNADKLDEIHKCYDDKKTPQAILKAMMKTPYTYDCVFGLLVQFQNHVDLYLKFIQVQLPSNRIYTCIKYILVTARIFVECLFSWMTIPE